MLRWVQKKILLANKRGVRNPYFLYFCIFIYLFDNRKYS